MPSALDKITAIIGRLTALQPPPGQELATSSDPLVENMIGLANVLRGQQGELESLRQHAFAPVSEEQLSARRQLSRLGHSMRVEDGAALAANLADAIELVLKLTRRENPREESSAIVYTRDGIERLRREDGSDVPVFTVLQKAEAYDELHARLWKRLAKTPEGRRREDVSLAELWDLLLESAAQVIHDTHGRVRRYMFDLLGWKEDGEHKGASAMDAAVEIGKKLAAVEAAEATADWSLKVAAAARELGTLGKIVRMEGDDERTYALRVLRSLQPEIGHLNELSAAMGCKDDLRAATWMVDEVRKARELLRIALPSIAKSLNPGLSVPLGILSDVVARNRERLCDAVPVDPIQRSNLTFVDIVEIVTDALAAEREKAAERERELGKEREKYAEARRQYVLLYDSTLTLRGALRQALETLGELESGVDKVAGIRGERAGG